MKTITLILGALLLVSLIHTDAEAQQTPVKVVTTLNYIKYVAQQVGGDKVSVTALANPRQDPHYVTPTPRMNQIAHDANLFIENGLSLDIWSKNVLDASGNPSIQPGSPGHLVATLNVPVKELPTEVSRAWGDIHPQGNPHVWLDPLNVKIVADNIAAKLAQLDGADAAYFQSRADAYKSRIDEAMFGSELVKSLGKKGGDILSRRAKNGELFTWLKSKNIDGKLGGWMAKARAIDGAKVVTYHKTYVYFADRFNVSLAGELEDKPGIPPPPKHRDEIVEKMKAEGIKVILNDSFYSKEAAEYVASKSGSKVVITYLDVDGNEAVSSYEKLISYLLDEISAAYGK